MARIKANADIRERLAEARKQGIYFYDVADELQICECTFTKWMRKELDEEKKDRVLFAISRLMKG